MLITLGQSIKKCRLSAMTLKVNSLKVRLLPNRWILRKQKTSCAVPFFNYQPSFPWCKHFCYLAYSLPSQGGICEQGKALLDLCFGLWFKDHIPPRFASKSATDF